MISEKANECMVLLKKICPFQSYIHFVILRFGKDLCGVIYMSIFTFHPETK